MIKKALVIVFLFTGLILAQHIGPKLQMNKLDHNFGNIGQDTVVAFKFVISNTGSDLLRIEQIRSSCGCTVAEPDKRELKPGESTTMVAKFSSEKRSGKQVKYIYMRTNDSQNQNIRLSIEANVVADKEATQEKSAAPKIHFPRSQHDFGLVKEGVKVNHTFTFTNNGDATLKINDVRSSCGCAAALLSEKEIKPGQEGKIDIELDTSNRKGRMSRTIAVLSNDPNESTKVLTIYAEIQ